MRKILLVAVCAATVAGCETNGKNTVELSATDPKYNSPECLAVRDKHYDDGTLEERMAKRVVGAAMWGGGMAVTAAEYRKRQMTDREVELACMSNPPDRSYLDSDATQGR
jgi:hypothetical protein